MRVNERMKKLLSIVLTLCMVLSYIPAPAYAVGTDCTHHTEHTADCGYVAAVEGVGVAGSQAARLKASTRHNRSRASRVSFIE